MNREEANVSIVETPNRFILAELPTGFGKSKMALDRMAKVTDFSIGTRILVVVPRLVLIDNWIKEFKKWGYADYLNLTEFVTYVSFPKKAGEWDFVIFDEVHHLSERCREALDSFKIKNAVMLSATVKREIRAELYSIFPNLYRCKVSTKTAIQDEVLPDPRVFLIPMVLDNVTPKCQIIKNKSQKVEIRIPFSQRFNYAKVKNRRIVIDCTEQQYYDDMSAMISWYKKKMFNEVFKNMFLRKSLDRLNWLSERKTAFISYLLNNTLRDQRTLTFCNGISQTEELGRYCINSKNKDSYTNLEKFNKGRINHITACNMLDEGMNLTNCRVGVYASLNSSDRMIAQKLGRLLRHQDPILIVPYYVNTRDEEIVSKMIEDYNPELVTRITNINQLTL